ncbi:hypothetical protein ACOME3_000581 [Neoechinorhynchus agilis]
MSTLWLGCHNSRLKCLREPEKELEIISDNLERTEAVSVIVPGPYYGRRSGKVGKISGSKSKDLFEIGESVRGLAHRSEGLFACGINDLFFKGEPLNGFNDGSNIRKMKQISNNQLAIASDRLRVWDMESSTMSYSSRSTQSEIVDLTNSEKLLTVALSSGGLLVYSIESEKPVIRLPEVSFARSLFSVGQFDRILIGTGTGRVFELDLRFTKQPKRSFKGAAGSIRALSIWKDRYVVSGGLEGILRIHSLDDGTLNREFNCFSRIECICCS